MATLLNTFQVTQSAVEKVLSASYCCFLLSLGGSRPSRQRRTKRSGEAAEAAAERLGEEEEDASSRNGGGDAIIKVI